VAFMLIINTKANATFMVASNVTAKFMAAQANYIEEDAKILWRCVSNVAFQPRELRSGGGDRQAGGDWPPHACMGVRASPCVCCKPVVEGGEDVGQ
jgi:hypothetical protein